MSERPVRASIVSGYFNPLHEGHLDMFADARSRSGFLIVIVNNDHQQVLKKGRVIQAEGPRVRIVSALRDVDAVYLAVETGPGINGTFDAIRRDFPATELEFCNGGDRQDVDSLPTEETAAAARNDITLSYGVGGTAKTDSSTRIVAELERNS